MPTHSLVLNGIRFKMTEGALQSTNTQLVLDKLTKEQCDGILREANRIKSTVSNHPVKRQLLQGIIMGCLRK
ncbi:hypothetical protein SEPL_379 [Salmonella phage SE_PL]|uniref:hypothetical protein n=1 Tax=Salmonella enterica TaxID=28901 RepID=UPI000FDF9CAE|nr:hypothetical protein CPT_Munch_043 [Salmonella phage Munch]EAR2661106.1 hypothetical protein [Salmonella enterica]EBU7866116.1 hypothetical protein [Salmonella enterica subsp. enterica serovar Kentucky]ECV9083976.1 hypothetical protein [Salmonella enterica subsp. enterica serovar Infantis]MCP0435924.1 hypothetical protein [Salmonella enterica subsp. enterica serovar Mbandaka]QCW18714.1 hypothetical protein 7t3_0193 [Salmonella phage 7t3]QIG62992.1 hypothetical protein SEPL_379 [Salmonella 